MNKYQKGFTPEEAALIAVSLESYRTLDNAEKHIDDELCLGHVTRVTGEQLNEAMDIIKALKEETWRAHEYEQSSSNQSSCLEIYISMYNQKFNGVFDTDYSQLTKASLAKWFEEVGEVDISKKFKEPEKVIAINPFKQAYTAEHAALISVGLNTYDSIDLAIESSSYQSELIGQAQREVERGGEYTDFEVDPLLEDDSISNAINIKGALIDEIKLAYKWEEFNLTAQDYDEIGINPNTITPNSYTDIIIHQEALNEDKKINYFSTLVTKESVATWLWNNGQYNYATNVLPNIESLLKDKQVAESKSTQQWNTTAQNTNNKEQPTKTTRTSDSSLIDSLGIMAWMLSKKIGTFQHGNKPNAKQIKDQVENIINELKLDNEDNKLEVSNLNKDISTALRQLEGRFKL
jgi:hypothetical protein